jgi:hypothetical protein
LVTDPRAGMRVRVPWGLSDFMDGEIVEARPNESYVLVRLLWGLDEDGFPDTSLVPLSPDWIEPAA